MNKLMINKGKAIFCLILTCLLLAQGCKKDLLTPNSNVLDKSISIEEAKQYFEQNILKFKTGAKLSSNGPIKSGVNATNDIMDDKLPMWDASKFKDLSIGTNAVLTPLNRPGAYVHISEKRMVKYGFLNYLMIHKDAENKIIAEWVELKPSEKWVDAKVSRKYDGKILVKDWDGKIKRIFSFSDGTQIATSKLKKSLLASVKGKTMSGETVCLVTTTVTIKTVPTLCPCQGHTYEQIANCTCSVKPTKSYSRKIEVETTYDCDLPIPDEPIDPPGGGTPGSTGVGNNGNGGSPNPNDYTPLNCNPDPNYTIPTVPPPPGTEYILPCSALEIPTEEPPLEYAPEPKTSAELLFDWFNSDPDLQLHLSDPEATFLNDNPLIANELLNSLISESSETKKLGKWAVGYLTTNPQGFDQAFRDLMNGIYNENSPVYIPINFDIEYTQEWYDTENQLADLGSELTQEGVHDTDPIPEMYYKNGTAIDMRPAPPKNGFTVRNAPRNKDYFWTKLSAERPEMFSQANRARLSLAKPLAPIIDEQWIKYNPTHKSYINGKLIHHHDEQSYMAFAIPEKVHQKWTKILHEYKLNGKMPGLSGKLNTLISVVQIFSLITDVNTSNPDAWVNWFSQQNEKGKIYADPTNNKYWEIMDQVVYKNSAGVAVKAIVHYNVYADFIWDSDEHRYMGVIKLNEFTEEVDLINNTSKEVIKKWL